MGKKPLLLPRPVVTGGQSSSNVTPSLGRVWKKLKVPTPPMARLVFHTLTRRKRTLVFRKAATSGSFLKELVISLQQSKRTTRQNTTIGKLPIQLGKQPTLILASNWRMLLQTTSCQPEK